MKAIKVIEPFKLEIVEIPKPVIENADDVIIKVSVGGICGSDVQIYNGTNALATYPRLIGHEFGGEVVEIGKSVTSITLGDKVSVNPVVNCCKCPCCRSGRGNVCETLEAIGVHRDGGFAEYVKVSEKNVHVFKTDFKSSLLSMTEPFTIGMQINNRGKIKKGDNVFIMGCGPIGLCILQVAKMNGARVIISDLVESKLATAKEMGADEIILVSKDNMEEKLNKFKGNEDINVIVDGVCLPSSFEQCIKMASPASTIVIIGLKNAVSEITMADITKKELDIVGSRLSNNCFDKVIECFENGMLKPEPLVTHRMNFKDVQKAFDLIKESPQDVLKIVLDFE